MTTDNRYYFLLRKLHSLTGVLPLGVFLTMHLATNASVLGGPEAFQRNVDRIHSLEPFLVPIEVFGIFLPVAFHAILGVRIWWTSESNLRYYPYADNIRYTLQRVAGLIALAFILYHLWHMHWLGRPFGGNAFSPVEPFAAVTAGGAIQRAWWIAPWYAVGITCACYHFANGLWTFLISWGVTIGPNAQRKAGYACAAVGLAVASLGLAALWRFDRTPIDQLRLSGPEAPVKNPSPQPDPAAVQGPSPSRVSTGGSDA